MLNRISYSLKKQLRDKGPSFFSYKVEKIAKEFDIKYKTYSISPHDTDHSASRLWTVVLPDHYSSPKPLRFIEARGTFPHAAAANELLSFVGQLSTKGCEGMSKDGKHSESHVLLLVGDDFSHSHAERSYRNLDKIIDEFNDMQAMSGGMYHAEYSNPSDYFQSCVALHHPSLHSRGGVNVSVSMLKEEKITSSQGSKVPFAPGVAIAKGHLLPYSDNFVNDWTGYFGSRPLLKHDIRYGFFKISFSRYLLVAL